MGTERTVTRCRSIYHERQIKMIYHLATWHLVRHEEDGTKRCSLISVSYVRLIQIVFSFCLHSERTKTDNLARLEFSGSFYCNDQSGIKSSMSLSDIFSQISGQGRCRTLDRIPFLLIVCFFETRF